jgi:ferredoxin/flavodoxin---NADP+ reductase
VIVDPADLELDPASEAALEADRARARRNVDILRAFAATAPSGKAKRLVLRFRVSPVAILGDGKVEAIEVVRNELVPDGHGSVRAVATEEREVIPCGVVFRSVGYRGVELPGVPFDPERATIRNAAGRVLDVDGEQVPGAYCAGWIKRGPTGVIGTNKKDATETVEALLEDARAGKLPGAPDATVEAVDALLAERGVEVVMYPGWELIDKLECSRGAPHGRPRIKLSGWDELLKAARG